MQDLWDLFSRHSECAYLFLSGVMGFIAAWLRSVAADPDASRTVTFANAGLCAMFSSSLTEIGFLYLHMPLEAAMPLGTFAGYLGAPTIVSMALQVLRRKLNIDTTEAPHDPE